MKASILLIAWSLLLTQHASAMSDPMHPCTPEETRHDVPDGKCEVTYACGNPPGLCEATYACQNHSGVVHVPIPGSTETHALGCSYASVTYWHDGNIKKRCCGVGEKKKGPYYMGAIKDPDPHKYEPHHFGDIREPDPHNFEPHGFGDTREPDPHNYEPHHSGDIWEPLNFGGNREPNPHEEDLSHQNPIGGGPSPGTRSETTLVIRSETGPGGTQRTEPTPPPEIHDPHKLPNHEDPNYDDSGFLRPPPLKIPNMDRPEIDIPYRGVRWPKEEQVWDGSDTEKPYDGKPCIKHPNDENCGCKDSGIKIPPIRKPWGTHVDDEKCGCKDCKKDKTSVIKVDEKDSTHVWACHCNEGEKPQLLPLIGTTIPSSCHNVHGAITTVNGKKVLYRCNVEFRSGGIWKKITTATASDCANKCTSGTEGKCLAASFRLSNNECYMATDKFTWHTKPGWVSMQFVQDDHVNCADIHGATKSIGGKKFKFACNEDFWSDHKWKNITATDVTDCAQKCTGGREGICLGASFDLNIKACYLAHVQPSWGHPQPGVVSLQFVEDDAAKKAAEEAAKKKHDADEAAKKKHDEDEAAKKKRDADEAAKKKHDADEAAKKKKHDADVAAAKKKHDHDVAAAKKKKHDHDVAAAAKKKHDADVAAKRETSHGTICPGVSGTRMMNGRQYHLACGKLTQAVHGDYPKYYHSSCPDAIECLRRINAAGARRGYFDGNQQGYFSCVIPKPEIENYQWQIYTNPGTVLITTYPI